MVVSPIVKNNILSSEVQIDSLTKILIKTTVYKIANSIDMKLLKPVLSNLSVICFNDLVENSISLHKVPSQLLDEEEARLSSFI